MAVADAGNGYRIESVELSTNGHRELYFDVKWSGEELDYYELRVFDREKNCMECMLRTNAKYLVVSSGGTININDNVTL